MQIDGLLRKARFDMVLRTQEALPTAMRQDLMRAFARGVSQSGLVGDMSFQTRQNWVNIDLPQHAGKTV
jgi:hypothetical protein